ncbi:MAG: DUF1493 family protein [Proteobacteria bacterium]|nr:DUF1493 family protein [Pseudomonadota bacterium]
MPALRAIERPTNGIEADLKTFLCERYWLPGTDYPFCADVFHALGLTGDDCHEFMNDFSDLFQVDLTDYVWPKYHLDEEEALDVRSALRPLMRFAGLKAKPLNRDLLPLSIDHLLRVAELHRWVDPEPGDQAEVEAGIGRSFARFSARLKAGGIPRRQRR